MEQRCDGITSCRDKSDEDDCRIVLPTNGYQKHIAPKKENGDLIVNFTISILNIFKIDVNEKIFGTILTIERYWFDDRLTYRNLNEHANKLDEEDQALIWFPYMVFNNIISEKKFIKTGMKHSLAVIKKGNITYSLPDMSYNKNMYLYHGAENMLKSNREWSIEWLCNFEMFYYPFDTQVCGMELFVADEGVVAIPVDLHITDSLEINPYFLRSKNICSSPVRDKTGILIWVSLGRPLLSNLLNYFLPTTILIIISFLAKIFEKNYLDLVVMVHLTVLLVLASL